MPNVTLLFVEQGPPSGTTSSGSVPSGGGIGGGASLVPGLRLAIEEHGGQVLVDQAAGADAVVGAFDDAGAAMAAAQQIRASVAIAARARGATSTGVRLGIHTGVAMISAGGGVYGIAALVSRRLCAEAEAGGARLSSATYALVEGLDGHEFLGAGPVSVPDLDRPVETWALAPARSLPSLWRGTTTAVGDAIDHPDAFLRLCDAWTAVARGGRGTLAVLAGGGEAGVRTIDALRARIGHDEGIDLTGAFFTPADDPVLLPTDQPIDLATIDLRPPPEVGLRAALAAYLAARVPPSTQLMLLGPNPTEMDDFTLLRALAATAPVALTAPAALVHRCTPDDLLFLTELGAEPGVFVAVGTDDEGQLATSPIAHLLSCADIFVRVGSVPGSATVHLARPVSMASTVSPGNARGPGAATSGDATPHRPPPRTESRVRFGPASSTAVVELPDGAAVVLPASGLVIGRGRDTDLQIDDPDVSRRHLRILPAGNGWLVEDLGSTNGTRVNDTRMQECRLSDGDVIQLGSTELRFAVRP